MFSAEATFFTSEAMESVVEALSGTLASEKWNKKAKSMILLCLSSWRWRQRQSLPGIQESGSSGTE